MEENKNYENNISLLDILVIFAKNKKLFIFVPLAFLIITFIVFFLSMILPADSFLNLLPNKYKPSVLVMLKSPGDSEGGISSLIGGSESNKLGSLVNMLGGSVSSGSSDLAAFVKVLLKANEIKDVIIKEYGFIEKYKIKNYKKTNSRKIFDRNLTITVDDKSNTMSIRYIDSDPIFATEVVNRIVKELEKKMKSLYLEKTNEKKAFLEERITIKESEFEKLQNKLITYQKKYGIINVSSQADKSISFLAELQSDIIQKEMQLKVLEKNSPYDKTRIDYLQYEIKLAKNLVDELKIGGDEYSNEFIPIEKLPELAKEYVNLNKDVTIQGLILEMLKQQYEATKIEESNKSQTFNVLEWAEIPEIKTTTSKILITIIVLIISIVIAMLISFIREFINNIKKDPNENEKFLFFKESISFFNKKIKRP